VVLSDPEIKKVRDFIGRRLDRAPLINLTNYVSIISSKDFQKPTQFNAILERISKFTSQVFNGYISLVRGFVILTVKKNPRPMDSADKNVTKSIQDLVWYIKSHSRRSPYDMVLSDLMINN
jgi:hypothetical protein